jgi:hypothetical protein
VADGQTLGIEGLLRALGGPDAGTVLSQYGKVMAPIGNTLLGAQEIYQANRDINKGASPSAAILGALANGLAIYGTGATGSALTFGDPLAGAIAGEAMQRMLPSNVTTGQAIINLAKTIGMGQYNSALYGGGD